MCTSLIYSEGPSILLLLSRSATVFKSAIIHCRSGESFASEAASPATTAESIPSESELLQIPREKRILSPSHKGTPHTPSSHRSPQSGSTSHRGRPSSSRLYQPTTPRGLFPNEIRTPKNVQSFSKFKKSYKGRRHKKRKGNEYLMTARSSELNTARENSIDAQSDPIRVFTDSAYDCLDSSGDNKLIN